jgi:hypothetical protein
MKMFKLAAAVATIAVSAFAFSGASTASVGSAECPAFNVEAKVDSDLAIFTIAPASDGLIFNWSVSAGTILSGQGTASIMVSVTGLPKGEKVSASVDVGGLDASCDAQASLSTTAEMP